VTAGRTILETVRWRNGRVRILDQTLLPDREVYLELETLDEVADAIGRLAVRGAPAIGIAGALGLAAASRGFRRCDAGAFLEDLEAAAARLSSARPTAVNLSWACNLAVEAVRRRAGDGGSPEELVQALLAEGERILEEDLHLSAAMGEHGMKLLPDPARVVTHCNTGGLATAGGGTALGVVLEAARRGRGVFVHVDETRPLLQGSRLTAWELQRAGIPYAIQADGAAAWLFRTQSIDAVLVGADRVAANGDTANKLGTFTLALAAREFGVPFYVVAPRSSFDLSLEDGLRIPIELRAEEEVLLCAGRPAAPAGARAWNPAFDVTPAALVSGWVTEREVEHPPFRP